MFFYSTFVHGPLGLIHGSSGRNDLAHSTAVPSIIYVEPNLHSYCLVTGPPLFLYGTFLHIEARNELFHRLIDTCVDCSHCGTKTPKIWGKKPKECTEGRCQEQALAIAESIFNTFERNRRWLWSPGQRYRGFWCYEWVTGFE